MEKYKKVSLLANIVLVGFVLAVIFHYVLGFYLGKPFPFNSFLFNFSLIFNDFTNFLPKIKGFAPYTPPADWQQYFPLSYLTLEPFAYIKSQLLSCFLYLLVFVSFFYYINIKFFHCDGLRKGQNYQNILILTFISYPFLCLVDRGNFDMILFIFFAFFIFVFQAKKYQLAAVLLGVLNAFKPFSLLFLLLFLFEKKYREFFLSIGTSFLLIIGGFLCFKGNIFDQISVMLQSWILFEKQYIYDRGYFGMINSSSLYPVLKFFLCGYKFEKLISIKILADIYKYFSMVVTILIAFFTFKEKVFWKKISLITLYTLLIPHNIYDYKLIFLFVPIYLFVNAEKTKLDLLYTILFGLLLIPKHYYIIDLMDGINRFSLSMILNPLILLIIIGLIVYEQFPNEKIEEINE